MVDFWWMEDSSHKYTCRLHVEDAVLAFAVSVVCFKKGDRRTKFDLWWDIKPSNELVLFDVTFTQF